MQNKSLMMREAYAANLRFFRQMCTAAKVKKTVELVTEAVAAGHCVVIGLQSTGEISSKSLRICSLAFYAQSAMSAV